MPTIDSMVASGWGDPTAPDYREKHIVSFEHDGRFFRVRREVQPLFAAFLILLRDKGGVDISTGVLDDWSWVVRPIRGASADNFSLHSWGLACDFDSSKNPLGSLGTSFPVRKTKRFAEDCSLTWGYLWRPPMRPDPMHFQFSGEHNDVRPAIRKLRERHPDVFATVTA